MTWWRITAYPDPSLLEEVAAVFVRHTGGVAVEDPALIDGIGAGDKAPDLVRPLVPVAVGYLPSGKRSVRRRRLLLADLADFSPAPRVVTGFCHSADWDGAWKKFYHMHRVGRDVVVVPAWEAYTPAAGETVLRLDPGPAFGTGTHPSTELCLEFLEEENPRGAAVADVGTGSGILAIAAVLMGARRVAATDVDPTALAWAAKNAALNGAVISFYEGCFLEPVGDGTFDLVTANLTADLLVGLASVVGKRLAPGGRLIAGGIITEKAAGVSQALERAGLSVRRERARGEWVAFCAVRGER